MTMDTMIAQRPTGLPFMHGLNMAENTPERSLLIRSRVSDGYHLSESGLKDLQHVFTDWFPRTIYYDLTDDTVSVDVSVRKDFISGKGMLTVSFKRQDGSVIKSGEYSQDRLIGKSCEYYDKKKAHYDGNRDGFDHRIVLYDTTPISSLGRLK